MKTITDLAAMWTAYAIFGWVVLFLITMSLYFILGVIGSIVFSRLLRVYRLNVLSYWLNRLEKEGKRTFERPD